MLAKISVEPRKWDTELHKIEFAMNNTYNRSIGNIPSVLIAIWIKLGMKRNKKLKMNKIRIKHILTSGTKPLMFIKSAIT